MSFYINQWLSILREWGTVASLPLIICGLGLTLFGWRLWKLCVILAFGIMGTVLGFYLSNPGDSAYFPMACGGLLLAAAAYALAFQAIGVLGGIIGAGMVSYLLMSFKFDGPPLWIGCAVGFFSASALAFINRRHVVIMVTAFLGATLLLSGIAAAAMAMPSLYGTFRSMASYSGIVAPFLLAVPAVMSYFYQISEVHRIREDL